MPIGVQYQTVLSGLKASIKENIMTDTKVDTEELFKLPQEEKLKIMAKELPLKVKVPFFTIGVLGVFANCLTSAFAGTVIYNLILSHNYTDFWAKFISLAISLFSLHILNDLMDRTGHWVIGKIMRGAK